MHAIDVSSNQGADIRPYLTRLTPSPDIVVVRAYLGAGYEGPSQQFSLDHARQAHDAGKYVIPYMWNYASYGPADCVARAWDLSQRMGVESWAPLCLDQESYQGSLPPAAWLRSARDACYQQGIRPCFYTGEGFWEQIGSPTDFVDELSWIANYPANRYPPSAITIAPVGRMKLFGWQYTDRDPTTGLEIDRSVFDLRALA